MSRLLQHCEIRKALSKVGIERPENDTLYLFIRGLYLDSSKNFQEDLDMISVGSVHCYYIYDIGHGRRRVGFTLSPSSEHHISQIFISIVFMKSGFMDHKSNLSFSENTPLELIKMAERIINSVEEGFQDGLPF